jgi:hypothetical protein
MGGSKKGEHRGNARKRPASRPTNRTHETPAEIMREATSKRGNARLDPVVIERRIMVARIINPPSDNIDDMTPKDVLLAGMHHHMGAIRDMKLMLEAVAEQPVTEDTAAQCNALDAEIERGFDKAGEFAFKVAGYIHAKKQIIGTTEMTGQSQIAILQELFDEINELEATKPIPIEHKPPQRTGS